MYVRFIVNRKSEKNNEATWVNIYSRQKLIIEQLDDIYFKYCDVWFNNGSYPNLEEYVKIKSFSLRIIKADSKFNSYIKNFDSSNSSEVNIVLNSNQYLNFLLSYYNTEVFYVDVILNFIGVEKICSAHQSDNIDKIASRKSLFNLFFKNKNQLIDNVKKFYISDFHLGFSNTDNYLRTKFSSS